MKGGSCISLALASQVHVRTLITKVAFADLDCWSSRCETRIWKPNIILGCDTSQHVRTVTCFKYEQLLWITGWKKTYQHFTEQCRWEERKQNNVLAEIQKKPI